MSKTKNNNQSKKNSSNDPKKWKKINKILKKIQEINIFKNINFPDIFCKTHKKSKLLKFRMIFSCTGTLISYFFLVHLLYFQDRVITSLIALFVFFAFFHFAFLDLRHRGLRQFWYIFGVLIVIEWLFLGFENWQVLASVTILNIAGIVLALWLDSESSAKRKFKSFSYFFVGGYIFTILSVISYSLFLLSGSSFKLSCDSLQQNTDQFVAFWANPFERWRQEVSDEVKQSQEKVKEIFDTKLKDILPWQNLLSIKTVTDEQQNSWNSLFAPLVDKFHTLQIWIDHMMEDNNVVNKWMCELVMEEINRRYNNPAFQFSVLALMFVVLYPFVRLTFFIISFLAFLIFKLMFLLKINLDIDYKILFDINLFSYLLIHILSRF